MRNDSADYKLKILTVSVGISAAPYAARSAKELLDNADLAVYHVKRSGKNGIEIFDTMLKESWMKKMLVRNPIMNIFISPMNPRSMR